MFLPAKVRQVSFFNLKIALRFVGLHGDAQFYAHNRPFRCVCVAHANGDAEECGLLSGGIYLGKVGT